jgi:formamidopyrimidine-DNA glycosylase
MPELPDVETFRRYFDATSLHKKITGVQVNAERVLYRLTPAGLQKGLEGDQFRSSERVGKYLFGELKASWMVFHFGMTGSFQYFKDPEDEPDHTAVLIRFGNGYNLAYIDIRKFGLIALTESVETFSKEKDLGEDALSIREDAFTELLQGKRGSIKTALMDQSLISGIGNIYSDEILFQAGIHPERGLDLLDKTELHHLFLTLREVLETAIDAGAEIGKFPDTYIIPHREKGGICPRCGQPLHTVKVGGRTAYFCPNRQKK